MRRRSSCSALLAGLAMLTFEAVAVLAISPDWGAVDKALGRPARVQPDGVRRFGWPRSDLHVTRDGVAIEPTLALGSWAAFYGLPKAEVMVMGDLVLLEAEVNPVVSSLQAGGLEVLAIHNHLIGETPNIIYLHFSAKGAGPEVAKALKTALERTATPFAQAAAASQAPSPAETALFERVEGALGRKGSLAGRVLQISVPRAELVRENGMEIPNGMGMAIALNFQIVGERVATTGDFVLVSSEVNPVIRELRSHGIEVTALHSHMLSETPRLFFLHFWGLDKPETVGAALKAALERVATK
jgi:Domain of Unknown Function (DUF1259)